MKEGIKSLRLSQITFLETGRKLEEDEFILGSVCVCVCVCSHTHTPQSHYLLVANDSRLSPAASDAKEIPGERLSFMCQPKLAPLLHLLSSRLYTRQTSPYAPRF